ncbi:MAG: c-type cytochrome biogenesis protein CcmI [Betaproteobacteria bacterium]|nr:c-type cytochrome biogenesis protein CcmI [Betaproteobacteria bacterium]
MTGFVLVAILMGAVAMAFVLVPLLRRGAPAASAWDAANVAVFRSQKREIEDEFARGQIDQAERDAALAELTGRVAEEVPAQSTQGPASRDDRAWPVIAVLAAVLPVAAAGLYLSLGSLRALTLDPMAPMSQAPVEADAHPGDGADPGTNIPDAKIVEMVDTLAKRMEQNPSDPKGWMLLARSQAALGRLPDALKAYEKAVSLKGDDAQLLADYADVAAMAQQGRFDGKPQALIARALKVDPNHLKTLVLAATAELKSGNSKASLAYWEKLRTLVPKESDDYRQVEAIIADVKAGKSTFLTANAAPAPAAPVPPPVAQRPDAPAPAKATAAASGNARVTGAIRLAPELAARLAPGDTLFVFARAKEGPRMPLAVLRLPAPKPGEFPKAFELTDGMAMAPGMSLSSFPEVIVEARISKTGNAQLSPGDLTGQSAPIKSTASGVSITIDKVAP